MAQYIGKFDITWTRLRALLDYDPETGILIWKKHRYRIRAGARAGYEVSRRYRRITVEGKEYAEHRLIWFWMTGKNPKLEMDHIDGDPSNNRWNNLRLATSSQNCVNMKIGNGNKTGYRGVREAKVAKRGKYFSVIRYENKWHNLGYFATAKEAHHAYVEAARKLHGEYYHENRGSL